MGKFVISGNLGAGKSTVIKHLESTLKDVVVCQEPIIEWKQWLDAFYENTSKNALGFQIKILLTFAKMYKSVPCSKHLITERCPFESVYVFSKLLLESDGITQLEYDLIEEMYNVMGWTPNVYIYIQTNPQVCIERIKRRGRVCENNIDEKYIIDLHNQYEKVMEGKHNVIYVNGNLHEKDVISQIEHIVKKSMEIPFST